LGGRVGLAPKVALESIPPKKPMEIGEPSQNSLPPACS
jgi:hypothetical protein